MSQDHDLPFDHAFERGMRNRRSALGDAWVDQSVAKANAFTAEFQHFITDYAWHGVWGRPGLDWKTRRSQPAGVLFGAAARQWHGCHSRPHEQPHPSARSGWCARARS
jgi:hypothetical protein